MADGWFVSNGRKQLGPFTPAKMRALAQAGKLRATMQISRDGSTWIKASESPFANAARTSPDEPATGSSDHASDLDPLPDPFANRDDEERASASDPENDDSGVIDSGPPENDDSGVIDSGPPDDDDSGVIDTGPPDDNAEPEDDDDSGVIAAVSDSAHDGDSDVILVPYEDDDDEPSSSNEADVTSAEDDVTIDGALDAPDSASDASEPGEIYRYRARGPDGREMIDELRAESAAQVFRRIRDRGLVPIMALPARDFAGWPDLGPRPMDEPGITTRLLARLGTAATAMNRHLLILARIQRRAASRVAFEERSRASAIALLHVFLAAAGLVIAERLGGVGAGVADALCGAAILVLASAVAWSTTLAAFDRARFAFGLLSRGPDTADDPARAQVLASLPGIALGTTLLVAGVYELAPSAFAWTEPPLPGTWLALIVAATLDALDVFGLLDVLGGADLVPVGVLGHALVACAQAVMLAAFALAVARELAERLPLGAAIAGLAAEPTRATSISALARWTPAPAARLARELASAADPTRRRGLALALAAQPAEVAQPLLVALAGDEGARLVRPDIAWAMGRLAAPGGAEQLGAWLIDRTWYPHRAAVLEALVATCDRHGAPGLVAFLADPNHADLHVPAARALVALDDPEQREALWALMDLDHPRAVRTIAAAGLGRIGGEDDLPLLDAVLDDESDPVVALWVRRALEAISTPESRGTLAALEDELDGLARRSAADAESSDPDATVRAPAVASGDTV